MNLLSAVIFLPLAGFLALLFFPKDKPGAIRWAALVVSLAVFVASLGLAPAVTKSGPGYTFVVDAPWIKSPAIRYHVGIDGISLWLVLLSTLLTPIAVLISWRSIDRRHKEFYALLLLLEFGLVGVFCAIDLFLFYVFWEVSLVPMYFLIGVWGHERRIYAAVKFFLFTMAGSVLMLAAIIYLYNRSGTFDYATLLTLMQNGRLRLDSAEQLPLFLAFFIAFAIKVPLFPLHTWLPDAHVEAPTAGSVMLASVMLKMGTYGLLRFCLPMFPNAARECAGWIVVLAIIGIIYGALVSLMQKDMKKLVAYSSVSHLGFCTLGIFALNPAGLSGSVLQQINHGISTGALFLIVGVLYERRHTREIAEYGGISNVMPVYATITMIMFLSSMGLPLLNGFVGEFTILQGTFMENRLWAGLAVTGVILAAAYLLWLYQRVFFGTVTNSKNEKLLDLSPREVLTFVPLVIMAFWIGIYPKPFFEILEQPVNQLVTTVRPGYPTTTGVSAGASTAQPASTTPNPAEAATIAAPVKGKN